MNNIEIKEIKKYFYEYFFFRKKSLFSNYIHNYIFNHNNKNNIINIITNVIIKYLYYIKNKIKKDIISNNYDLYKLNKLISEYYNDINYLSQLLNDYYNDIYKILLNYFVSYILTDIDIIIFLKNIFIKMDNIYHNNIILLFNNINKLTNKYSNIYYNN